MPPTDQHWQIKAEYEKLIRDLDQCIVRTDSITTSARGAKRGSSKNRINFSKRLEQIEQEYDALAKRNKNANGELSATRNENEMKWKLENERIERQLVNARCEFFVSFLDWFPPHYLRPVE